MFCPKCGNQLNEGASFCPSCGTNLNEFQNPITTPETQPPVEQQPTVPSTPTPVEQPQIPKPIPKKLPMIPIIIIISILIIGTVGIGIFMKETSKRATGNNNQKNIQDNYQNNNEIDNNNSDVIEKFNFDEASETCDKDESFQLDIEDVFAITGRGTVASGKIIRGTVKVGDKVQIIGLDHETITTTVEGIEQFRNEKDFAECGNNVGLLIKDVAREDIERGQTISKPNSLKAIRKYDAKIYLYSKEEGGRNVPFFNRFEAEFWIGTAKINGIISMPDYEMAEPGKNAKITVRLEKKVAMEEGTLFRIISNQRTIGNGVVTKTYDE